MDLTTLLDGLAEIRRKAELLEIDTATLYVHINDYELGARDWTPELDGLRAQAQEIMDGFDALDSANAGRLTLGDTG